MAGSGRHGLVANGLGGYAAGTVSGPQETDLRLSLRTDTAEVEALLEVFAEPDTANLSGAFFGRRRAGRSRRGLPLWEVDAYRRAISGIIPAGRKNRWKSHLRSGRQSFRPSPGLHQSIFWQIWIKNFVPPFHMFSTFGENHLNTLAEVGLQVAIIFYGVGAHPFLNFFVAIPIFSIDFVTT